MATADEFVNLALSQRGKPYVWGAEGPNGFDCSGLVDWCCSQLGVSMPRTAAEQLAACKAAGTTLPVPAATLTRGALLFRVGSGATNHVVISLGTGNTIEAMGKAYGVRIGGTVGRVWTGAGLVPGLTYGTVGASSSTDPTVVDVADHQGDGNALRHLVLTGAGAVVAGGLLLAGATTLTRRS